MKWFWFLTILCCTALQASEEQLNDKLAKYNRLLNQREKLCKEKKELAEAIIAEMQNGALETLDFKVACRERLAIHTSLEEARRLGATKMVEQVDKAKIKALYLSGVQVEGVEKQFVLSLKPKK